MRPRQRPAGCARWRAVPSPVTAGRRGAGRRGGAGLERRGFPDQGVAHCDSFVRFALILGDFGGCLQAGR